MITEFKLIGTEAEKAKAFEIKHQHPGTNKGAIGGHISYRFTPTSVANAVSVRCSICGEEENITDYSRW